MLLKIVAKILFCYENDVIYECFCEKLNLFCLFQVFLFPPHAFRHKVTKNNTHALGSICNRDLLSVGL